MPQNILTEHTFIRHKYLSFFLPLRGYFFLLLSFRATFSFDLVDKSGIDSVFDIDKGGRDVFVSDVVDTAGLGDRYVAEYDLGDGRGDKRGRVENGFSDSRVSYGAGSVFDTGDGEVRELHIGVGAVVELNGVGDESESGIGRDAEVGSDEGLKRSG